MRLPSIKSLEKAFPGKGKELRSAFENCAHPMHCVKEASRILGVDMQHIPHQGSNSPSIRYANMGDTYATTIMSVGCKSPVIGNWGDIVERGNYA